MLTPTGVTASAYWDAIKAGNIQHIRMTFSDGTVLDEQDVLSNGIVIHDIMNGDTDLTFGKAVMKQVNIPFINSDRVSNIQWASEFTLEMGVEIGGSTNWVKVGTFKGEVPDKIHYVEVIDFIANDRMQMFDTSAEAFLNGLAYPKTFSQILAALCSYVGVEYVAGDELANIKTRSFSEGFINSDVITCRDLLAVMAEACGCYAKITPDGKLKMVWFSSASHSVTADQEFQIDSFDVSDGMTWDEAEAYTWDEIEGFTWDDLGGFDEIFSVAGLTVKLTENDLGVSFGDTAGNVYLIVDNPFLVVNENSDINTYIKPIYDRLVAFGGYLPINVNCIGNWLVETGDVITVDVHGTSMSLPVFTNEIAWNGSCFNTFESTGSKRRQVVSSSNRTKLTNGGKYHELIVDIDQLHSEIGDRTGSSTTITQDIQNLDAVAQRKSSVWTSRSDPALTEPVQESDIWIRKRFATWDEVKAYYATWNALKADNDEWNSLFIEDMYYRRGGSWYKNYDAVGEFDTLNNKYTIRSGIHIEPEGVEIDGGKYIKMKSGSNVNVESGGKIDVKSGGDIDVESGGDINVKSGGNLNVASGGNIDINGSGNLKLTGSTVEIKSGSSFNVDSTNFTINSLTKILKTGEWELNQYGLYSKYNSPTYGDVYAGVGFYGVQAFANDPSSSLSFNYTKNNTTNKIVGQAVFDFYRSDHSRAILKIYDNEHISSDNSMVFYAYGNDANRNSENFKIALMNDAILQNATVITLYYSSLVQNSSKDIKHNIKPLPSIGDRLDTLKPVTFVYDDDENEKQRMGLIYEDTVQTMPEICTDDESNKAINYVELIPALLKEIQDLRARVKQLEERVEQ